MSTAERGIETNVARKAISRAWADVEHWPEWNADVEQSALSGPFATGSTIAITPRRQETVQLRIAAAVEGELFVDEAEVDGTVVRTVHCIDRLDGDRVRIVYRLEATGPEAQKIGAAVSADFPETIAALIEHGGR